MRISNVDSHPKHCLNLKKIVVGGSNGKFLLIAVIGIGQLLVKIFLLPGFLSYLVKILLKETMKNKYFASDLMLACSLFFTSKKINCPQF
jgi:hypothetical protein